MNISIRLEKDCDHKAVEELAREAFWNLHIPGCDEHYLIHNIRSCPDFIPNLDFVAVNGDKIVGSVIYTKSYILDPSNQKHETITFGPISVLPQFQRQGIGKALIEHTKKIALGKGYKAIIIYGYPTNYCMRGFKGSKRYGITDPNGKYPFSLLALELFDGALNGISGKFYDSEVYRVNQEDVEKYDKQFVSKEKALTYTQEEFTIASHSFLI